MLDRAGDAITSTYGVPLAQAFGGMMGGGQTMGGMMQASCDPVLSFLTSLTYAGVLLMLSIWVTKRREMI
jgi:hypothetical protein